MRKRTIATIAILLTAISLFAEITVTYDQESPLVWTNETYGISEFSGHLTSHIGQLVISIPKSDNAFNPMLTNIMGGRTTTLSCTDAWGNHQTTGAHLYAVTKLNGKWQRTVSLYSVDTAGYMLLLDNQNGTLKGNTITVDFYLCTFNGVDWFKKDSSITITTDYTLGQFAISNNSSDNLWDTDNRIIVPITGGFDDNHFEFIDGGVGGGTIDSTYGEAGVATGVFDIFDKIETIDLSAVTGNNKTTVAKLAATISGQKTNYDLSITIRDDDNNDGFSMHNASLSRAIPFTLLIGDDEVSEGMPYLGWKGLQNGKKSIKELKVTGVNQNISDSLLAGTYTDTISVTFQVL